MIPSSILFLSFLYFVQGLPSGLQTRFLPIYFRTHGMSLSNVGFFRLLFLPWMMKALWAPLVDEVGSKKQWLTCSMLGIAVTCFVGSYFGPDCLTELIAVLFVFNILTSTQDIVVDALAIQILSSSELCYGNIAQVVGYKFGSLCGGGLLTWLSEYVTWMFLFRSLSLVYLAAVAAAIIFIPAQPRSEITIILPPPGEIARNYKSDTSVVKKTDQKDSKHAASTSSLPDSSNVQNDVRALKWLKNHVSVTMRSEGTMWTIYYVLMYKLGEQGALIMIPLFLVDHKMPASEVGFWTGLVGMIISIFGSFLGGWAIPAYRMHPLTTAKTITWVRVALIGVVWAVVSFATVSEQKNFHGLYVFVIIASMMMLLLFSGMITTMTFTLMMQCTQRAPSCIQASHYSTLATMEVVGKLTFSVLIGPIADLLGYPVAFFISLLLAAAVLPFFSYAPPVFRNQEIFQNKNS